MLRGFFSKNAREIFNSNKGIKIFFYTFLVMSIVAFSGHWVYHYRFSRVGINTIDVIVQRGPVYCALSTPCLAELLGLCADKKSAFSSFDIEGAYKSLEKMHIMQHVQLKKIRPHTLCIEYVLRKPIALLQDYTNTAIDIEGNMFAFAPFYSPRHLPLVCLPATLPSSPWGEHLEEASLKIVKDLFNFLGPEVEQIDLSHMHAASLGEREVVVSLEGSLLLRLPVQECREYAKRYLILKKAMGDKFKGVQIVDMRLPDMAFLQRAAAYTEDKHSPLQGKLY